MSLQPDGFIGTCMAVESMDGAKVLLHGPIGCRRDIGFISGILCPKPNHIDIEKLRGKYFLNNHRAPCTEIQPDDYVSGATYRLIDALKVVSEADDEIIAVISTPGTSLIGDSAEDVITECGLNDRAIAIDADYISLPLSTGFDLTLTKLIRWIAPERRETVPGTVNILGTSVFLRDWPMVIDDLTELLEAMGLRVICAPGTRCSVEQVGESVAAQYNVAVCSEYCRELSSYYEEKFGIPTVDMHRAPVGFHALKGWVLKVAETCGRDPEPALEILRGYVDRAYRGVQSSKTFDSLKGHSLAAEGDATVVGPLVEWLYSYAGLVPAYVRLYDGSDVTAAGEVRAFLESIGCGDALDSPMPEFVDVLACDGDTARRMELGGRCGVGIDIGFPSLYEANFMAKNVVGQRGVLYILERLVSNLSMMSV